MALSIMTFNINTVGTKILSIMALRIKRYGIMALSITTFNINTAGIKIHSTMTLSIITFSLAIN